LSAALPATSLQNAAVELLRSSRSYAGSILRSSVFSTLP
jgi:hypothetical protein